MSRPQNAATAAWPKGQEDDMNYILSASEATAINAINEFHGSVLAGDDWMSGWTCDRARRIAAEALESLRSSGAGWPELVIDAQRAEEEV
jgi:hypothetical protein